MGKRRRMLQEEKASIVESYLSGEMGKTTIISRYGIGWTTVRDWVRLYETRGAEGLEGYGRYLRISPEIKNLAVQEYLEGKVSQSEICKKYDISSRSTLRGWIKWYNGHGCFKCVNSGGVANMSKGRDTTLEERIEIVSHCIANNKDYGKTIAQYNVSYQQVYSWVRKYENDGAEGLADRRGKRKDEASMTEVEKLRAQLKLKDAENLRLQMENDLLKKLEEIERRRGRS